MIRDVCRGAQILIFFFHPGFRIPGVKKALDLGSGSATPDQTIFFTAAATGI
jgi:hypothetical protein